jgi:alginate O-acetyltransferase complex protein AlgI
MLGFAGGDGHPALVAAQLYGRGQWILMALAAGILLSPLRAHDWSHTVTWPKALALAPALVLAVMAMCSQAFNPFLYFQF